MKKTKSKNNNSNSNHKFDCYIDFNSITDDECRKLWNYVFSKADACSFVFPNDLHSVSNQMKIQFNDDGEVEQRWIDYLDRNKELIQQATNNLIIKSYTDKYYGSILNGKMNMVFVCRPFEYLKSLLLKNKNLFEWISPYLPENLYFLKNNQLLFTVEGLDNQSNLYYYNEDKELINDIFHFDDEPDMIEYSY